MLSAFATVLVVERARLRFRHRPRLVRVQTRPIIHRCGFAGSRRRVKRQAVPRLALFGQDDFPEGLNQLPDLGEMIAQVANGCAHSDTIMSHEGPRSQRCRRPSRATDAPQDARAAARSNWATADGCE